MAYEALYTRGRPKILSQLVGQEHISSALTRAIMTERLSHAYLLVGTRGTGKTSTARLLAKAMNCENVQNAVAEGKNLTPRDIPCNKCASCLSIESSPDNVEFDAASNRSVEDVTRLLSTAHLAPLQSKVKTFIIDEVHMLSFEAVNSILKLIEEPPPNVAFFLATTELQKVPMTIRSRCQVLNFRLIPQNRIEDYLQLLAKRLQIKLEEDAAKKISRLAEGSMRDAITYLDQCYSMSENVITLDDVNKTLGLISDYDLDEIISAVKNKNRADVGKAIIHAFQSGLTSISIAESLITRLRDLEFNILSTANNSELNEIENFVSELRKSILEMQGSGIPDIILEMALMNLAAQKVTVTNTSENTPVKNLDPVPVKKIPVQKSFAGTIEQGQNIFNAVIEKLRDVEGFGACIDKMKFQSFSDNVLTIKFRSDMYAKIFNEMYEKKFVDRVREIFRIKIEVKTVSGEDSITKVEEISNPEFKLVKNSNENKFFQKAQEVFQAEGYQKINDEE